MNNYENQIIDAIEAIVDKKISLAGYDKTIKASIIKVLDINTGKYQVKYQDSSFEAYASDLSVSYSKDDIVYILIPSSDTKKDKSILGKIGGNTITESVTSIANINAFEKKGIDCINDGQTFGLSSYKEKDTKILYDIDDEINLINLSQSDAKEYLGQSSYLVVGVDIKNNLATEQKTQGNFGITYVIAFKDEKNEIVLKKYTIDVNNMVGNPYKLEEKTSQFAYFKIEADKYQYIKQIYLFENNFPNVDISKGNDIFFSDIKMYGGEKITEDEYNINRLVLNTPDGNYFTEDDEETVEKTITAIVKKKGEEIDLSKSKPAYYWFKQNSSISSDSENYVYYGGSGWECLNSYTENEDGVKTWSTSYSYLKLKKSDVTFSQNEYKCVLVLGEDILENTITIKNYDADMSISIISDTGQQYYYDSGYPTLTCLVNNEDRKSDEYKFYWSVVDSNNQYTSIDETEDLNTEYNNAVAAYNQLVLDVQNEIKFENEVAEELQSYLDIIEKYEYTQRVEKNVISKINVNTIYQFATYKCTVFYNNKDIGTTSYTIYNQKLNVENNYNLEIVNGNQVFKYNENGISPANSSLENPIEIKPLSFKIYDDNGLELDDLSKATCTINWIVPTENTMIITDEVLNEETLSYTIEDIYDSTKYNNTIELRVQYKQYIISAYTNLTFIKEGGIGTNGTEYVCRIVPNTSEQIDYPYILNKQLNYTPNVNGKWFNVQLWKNGKKIFDNYLSGNSSESRRVLLKWEVLRNKYSARYKDESNFTVTSDGTFTYQDLNTEDGQTDPANIIKCTVTYNNLEYYAMLPIPIITVTDSKYKIKWKKGSGFNYVEYSSNGLFPKYNSLPFEITVLEKINSIDEDVSNLTASHAITYNWNVRGEVFDLSTKTWSSKTLFEEDGTTAVTRCQKMYKPSANYDGECVTTAIECECIKDTTIIGKVLIPIHMMINRYENAVINGWDGNSIEIKEDQGYILTPQIGAGKKEDGDNSFTGMIMGESKDGESGTSKTGLLGYKAGEQTLFLDAETGGAIFGKNNKGQILIDPKSEKSLLYSHNYWKSTNYDEKGFPINTDDTNEENISGEGLLIDLSTPTIKYGNGTKFQIDENGNVSCGNLISDKGILTILQIPLEKANIGLTLNQDTYTTYEYSQYPTKMSYVGEYNFSSINIPENFTIVKAECILISESGIGTAMVPGYVGLTETYANFPSFVWGVNSSIGSGYFHTVPIDNLSVYYAPDTAFSTTSVGEAYSDVFYTDRNIDFTACEKLKSFSGNFIDLDTNGYSGNYFGKNQFLKLDITDEIKSLRASKGDSFYLSIGPTSFPSAKTFTWSFKTVDYETQATATPKITPIELDASHRKGACYVGYYIYGYYDI